MVRFARRLKFSFSQKKQLDKFEGRMRGFVLALSIVQTRYYSREITTQISRSLDEPWDQRPMKFQDAIGRRYPVPLEVCNTFEVSPSSLLELQTVNIVKGLRELPSICVQGQRTSLLCRAEFSSMAVYSRKLRSQSLVYHFQERLGAHRQTGSAARNVFPDPGRRLPSHSNMSSPKLQT